MSFEGLPEDLLGIITQAGPDQAVQPVSGQKFLNAVSEAALTSIDRPVPFTTETIFVYFEDVFPDLCARWLLSGDAGRHQQVTTAFSRILPFSPHLSTFLRIDRFSTHTSTPTSTSHSLHHTLTPLDDSCGTLDENSLLERLLALWRLCNFDVRTFGSLAPAEILQDLFRHSSRVVRYIAIRIFCLCLRASDVKLEALISEHVGSEEPLVAMVDGTSIDVGFFSLYEQTRADKVASLRREVKQRGPQGLQEAVRSQLTPYVIAYGSCVIPRPLGPTTGSTGLVPTSTTTSNLEQLAYMLRQPDPIMLYGSPGVGKTSLVREVAKELGMSSTLVTLHLNEQTDAKMLIGLYSTDSKPGSFQWRPGVLSTAVKEGRWVLIEDLDRAPTEVLSTLLPLIERNELLVPSRGETIRAAPSFRLFATVRTLRNMKGKESLPSIVGMRFWQTLHAQQLKQEELQQIILQTYPILRAYVPGILAVYSRVAGMSVSKTYSRSSSDRQANLRDLLKWCRRLTKCLVAAGVKTGEEPISETTRDFMLMEALDCFVGSSPSKETSSQLVYAIAEEMQMSKDRADHYLTANIPPFDESESQLQCGRIRLAKHGLNQAQAFRRRASKRRFATTTHAKKLLEQIAASVQMNEPVLLVGETGIGKTTVVQQLAETLGRKLIAVNLSQQSEAGDLLGGFKPVSVQSLAVPLKEEFEDLFAATGISASRNQRYLEQIGKCFVKGQWSKVSKLWREAPKMFKQILDAKAKAQDDDSNTTIGENQPAKRQKTESRLQMLQSLQPRWETFAQRLQQFDVQISGGSSTFAFSFIEGNLVKAVRNGDWVLLDEINLASPDTLESIADLLTGPGERPSLLLSETGEIERIEAHANFRIFGAMNPATDIGKRDLPIGIRSRFTELYVRSPDTDLKDLLVIIKKYLEGNNSKNDQAADDIARLYMNTKRMAEEKRLVDGANEVPHFSLRTLTRVLSYVNDIAPYYGLHRALFEGFSMGFLTLLDRESEKLLVPLMYHHLLDPHGNPQTLLSRPARHPNDGKKYVRFQNKDHDRQYWLFQGDLEPAERDDYIITPYVERNLLNLVRATSTRRFPILIQGPTSAGKTSMIEYLANFTGNKFVRINNHEHTDLQEYLGTYVSDQQGKLRFQEGVLIQAMRQGHWIVLDELNLAPTDVLEALNRLLDDNRELLIPETQEVVRPHENFILFATQNPPGLYGGRKILSRAFRNRFLELHFDDIPNDELEFILQKRSRNTSPPDCRRIVEVYKELARLRQVNRLFEQRDSFATLRDLFRWALREADTREEIAAHGFMLLAERVRNAEERTAVKEIIEKVFKVNIDPNELYSADKAPELKQFSRQTNSQGVIWTQAMRRLYVLVSRAMRNNEPILMVGETGCGKTTVCQLLAEALQQKLHIVNAHQNTETGDLIGSQRPIRNRGAIVETLNSDIRRALESLGLDTQGTPEERLARYKGLDALSMKQLDPESIRSIIANETRSKALFEWADGALVEAMRDGQLFLLDEISLADDSVLERLNSVLEPQRTLLLAEKGIDNSFVQGADGFHFFATMNPGGDFGKKELSPALRNRFTEIWVPALSETEDILEIVRTKLGDSAKHLVDPIVNFASWFGETFRSSASTPFSIREILSWVQFINLFSANDPIPALVHGASAVFIDSIGANPSNMLTSDTMSISQQRQSCVEKLGQLVGRDVTTIYQIQPELSISDQSLTIGDFTLLRVASGLGDPKFAFHAPTTRLNAMRVLRALQMQKPVLLEGSPGVGKTTLVAALAQACGRPLTRINLSDQTDLMDLFGTDVPVEGEEAGNFAWRDAPFLQAMQKGDWVLLDEMNLASQSVLEGLNACLDHRGEVYVSELDQVFKRHPDFRLFAAQNPHHQGGGRKGLPASFVNRFIVVHADIFSENDLMIIASHNYPELAPETVRNLINFVSEIDRRLVIDKSFGLQGGPWEFNLRDVLRWLQLLSSTDPLFQTADVDAFLDIVVRQRFRTEKDRAIIDSLFEGVFGWRPREHSLHHDITPRAAQVGLALLERSSDSQPERLPSIDLVPRLAEVESLMICVKNNIPCILSGASGSGKSALLSHVAALAGKPLVIFPMNADIDTMDLVGGFEQADPLREVNAAVRSLNEDLRSTVLSHVPAAVPTAALKLMYLLNHHGAGLADLLAIASSVEHLLTLLPEDAQVRGQLQHTLSVLRAPLTVMAPRFEWLDGVIVKALEAGQWLVLDNANLCNASVLDRLNSLLEPNGFLSINEHCGPEGEPRVITPHPEFRIFLTVDPKFGELSRAMRNRAIEIHLRDMPPQVDSSFHRLCEVESRLRRFLEGRDITDALDGEPTCLDVATAALDGLSYQDLKLLPRFSSSNVDAARTSQLYNQKAQSLEVYCQSGKGELCFASTAGLYDKLPDTLRRLQNDMTLHPLGNPIFSGAIPNQEDVQWQSAHFETCRLLYGMQEQLSELYKQAQGAKLSSLGRIQRSLISDRVAAVSKDSTVKLARSVNSVIETTFKFLNSSPPSDLWKPRASFLRQLCHYYERVIALTSGDAFRDAVFQAYIVQGLKLVRKHMARLPTSQDQSLLKYIADRLSEDFTSGYKLTTGLSMEQLWNTFRPTPFSGKQVCDNAVELHRLADRFDDVRWKIPSTVSDMSQALTALRDAYKFARKDTDNVGTLIQGMEDAVKSLESRVRPDAIALEPFFARHFETLRQVSTFRQLSNLDSAATYDPVLALLADAQTRPELMLGGAGVGDQILHSLSQVCKPGNAPWSGKFTPSLWTSLQSLDAVSLKALALLEEELPMLGKYICNHTKELATDPLRFHAPILWELLRLVFRSHSQDLEAAFYEGRAALSNQSADDLIQAPAISHLFERLLYQTTESHLHQVILDHLAPAMVALAAFEFQGSHDPFLCCSAWHHFGVGTLRLFVPDRVSDPQLRPLVEMEFAEGLQGEISSTIAALRAFETKHTGRLTNARISYHEQQLAKIGSLPVEVLPIYRPDDAQLPRLQAEFSNVLKAISSEALQSTLVPSTDVVTESEAPWRVAKENISRLLDRLSTSFEAYQDVTVPVSSLLQSLTVALSLRDACAAATLSESSQALMQCTPFLGGPYWQYTGQDMPTKSFEFLNLIESIVSIEGIDALALKTRESVFECFHGFFDDWSKRLETDRQNEEAKASLYQFRGSLDDEEELNEQEFSELFPTFDEDGAEKPAQNAAHGREQVRNISVRVAKVHRSIFTEKKDSSFSLKTQYEVVASRITAEMKNSQAIERSLSAQMLATTLLTLDDKTATLQNAPTDKDFNFYSDKNLTEARKLVALANEIKSSYRGLQLVDEIGHFQPLEDITIACDQLLDLVHTEPLAKILPKAEILHARIYEWQSGGWASKVYTFPEQYTSLTDTLIRWRQLELSTWARLFDMEEKKCHDDADSWWFVAYQVVIATPLSMVDSVDQLKEYARSLIQNLELYFSTSIIGQFRARLSLLKQLQAHLRLLTVDYPTLQIIQHALVNFMGYYSRYEKEITETIKNGRLPIEKKMKDVLLMASWKDTNINALRESARKSHQKLFRLVRKFRSVLGQETKTLITRGLPDETMPSSPKSLTQVAIVSTNGEIPREVRIQVDNALPGWLADHRRLTNNSKTVFIMGKIAANIQGTPTATTRINDFMAELNASIAELRKETPSTLTKENKGAVKHLKNRKRKLFADTLRDLRKMGIIYNLAQDKLLEQDDLAIILASLRPLELGDGASLTRSTYFFHKVLDIIPSARAASREHSEELSGAEVERCVGFIEGLTMLLRTQRSKLASSERLLGPLKTMAKTFADLGRIESTGGIQRETEHSNIRQMLPWIVEVLNFSINLIEIHGKFTGADRQATVEHFSRWRDYFARKLADLRALSSLSPTLTSKVYVDLEGEMLVSFSELQAEVHQVADACPELEFILRHMTPWTRPETFRIDVQWPTAEIRALADAVSHLCDTALVAVERVNKAASTPRSDEDANGWLVKQSEESSSLISEMRLKTVEKTLAGTIAILKDLDLNNLAVHGCAVSILAIATPIIDQFIMLSEGMLRQGHQLHEVTAEMAYNLAKTFTQMASQGFCSPQEKSEEKSGDSNQLESGTGLGDGEGAQDISKDIQDDEDLSELAQERNKEDPGEIEDEKDAVDMADEELEGDMGSVDGADDDEEGSKTGDDEEENEMDEEAGDVDDLDPTAMDEKTWDADEEEAEKDQKGDQANSSKKDDEQIAADEDASKPDDKQPEETSKNDEDQPEGEDEVDEEKEDAQAQEEMNRQDENVEQKDTLDLPEDMDLNMDDQDQEAGSSDDEEMDRLSDVAEEENATDLPDDADEDMDQGAEGQNEHMDEDPAEEEQDPEAPAVADKNTGEDDEKDEMNQEDQDAPEQQEMDPVPNRADDAKTDTENAAPSDVKSAGQDENQDSNEAQEDFQGMAAQQEDGEAGEGAADQDANAGKDGAQSQANQPQDITEQEPNAEESSHSNPFKKMGDMTEQWHRQQTEIKQAEAKDESQPDVQSKPEADQGMREFEHLQNDDTAADAQAMGGADDEQIQPLDESMAIDDEREVPNSRLVEEPTNEDDKLDDPDAEQPDDSPDATEEEAKRQDDKTGERTGVQTKQGNLNKEESPSNEDTTMVENVDDQAELEETSEQLSTTHISDEARTLRDFGECLDQWAEFQSKTNASSMSLTSQLRLILTPSQSTKLSGSFRTGKRLNIKRIIPYIASSYKRDKIWMRRSIPTKRTYQILLCVDDSRSMGESDSGALAMESLVMVSRSLTMLEAGQVGVMGFGRDVFSAHSLTDPFAADAGAKILQQFTFDQDRTDVALLIRRTIDTFRDARQQSSGGSDLWQLSLILSDGLTPSSAHESIRRLLREAMEERIMVVLIIMDDTSKKEGDSVLKLQEAKLVKEGGESKFVIRNYLDTFPFQYYLIVHHLEELPGALAGLLRTWFAEVSA